MGIRSIANGYQPYGAGIWGRPGDRKRENAADFVSRREKEGDRIILSRREARDGTQEEPAAKELIRSEADRLLEEELVQALRAAKVEDAKEPDTAESKSAQEQLPESERQGGAVAFNAAKRARQLAAASSRAQVQAVLSLLRQDLSDCKYGVENGMCDQAEVDKVKAMLQKAQQRMSELSQDEGQEEPGGFDAFAIASLM